MYYYTDSTINISFIDGSGNVSKCSLNTRLQGGKRYCCNSASASRDTSFSYQAGKRYVKVDVSGYYKDVAKIESVEVNGKVLDAYYDMSNGSVVSAGGTVGQYAWSWFFLSIDNSQAYRQIVIDFDTSRSVNFFGFNYDCYNSWWSF
jgi:hypothetical protein